MGIDAHICCDFFDGFMSYIEELMYEDHPKLADKEYFNHIWKYDTIDNLWNWYCCFDINPLPITTNQEEI
jgi:hypothetical protein